MSISEQPYSYLSEPEPGRAHIRFSGPFQGTEVIWNAQIVTLTRYHRKLSPGKQHRHAGTGLRQFIEVGAAGHGMRNLLVVLNVPSIDEPVIRNTIIMIRKYKRLRPGRHEFGTPWNPAP